MDRGTWFLYSFPVCLQAYSIEPRRGQYGLFTVDFINFIYWCWLCQTIHSVDSSASARNWMVDHDHHEKSYYYCEFESVNDFAIDFHGWTEPVCNVSTLYTHSTWIAHGFHTRFLNSIKCGRYIKLLNDVLWLSLTTFYTFSFLCYRDTPTNDINRFVIFVLFSSHLQAKILQNSQAWLGAAAAASSTSQQLGNMSGK